ncbi:Asp/Glu racemase [Pseudooceanicola sp. CBS1P-1]|uniref:Asp/Glu racemase n=1 Tax=Pseudooceanicola albus TaxID=2692189 RepID=A0A6L7G1F2_9RHOB|nr:MULTISPECIES: Asp/Glu racemase [Pseudooceanicola]MBT9383678.1 Asp/Glu racemase [Pseudooceanicola endophyticus]MXN17532.1 Asp/Glu racemase [Pseudooceanicola albus]
MSALTFTLTAPPPAPLGLIVLQSDQTIEADFRRLLPARAELLVSRVPSGLEVTPKSLAAMEGGLAGAAGLFPRALPLSVVGYGCTSGAAQIGSAAVAAQITRGVATAAVTNPVAALIAACRHMGLRRLGLLSPYVAAVSGRLRAVLSEAGIDTPVFGSFEVAEEARVARIDAASISAAALALAESAALDALFLSCTNLRTLDVIPPLEARLGLPVLASNPVLAWDMLRLAGLPPGPGAKGRLFAAPQP